MERRDFIRTLGAAGAAGALPGAWSPAAAPPPGARAFWLSALLRIARPVLGALAEGRLRRAMPVEHHPESADREQYTHLEAFGRTMAGLAPWLALVAPPPEEAARQAEMRALVQAALAHAVDPGSPDYMNFSRGGQPLVDAAFLAHALLRAPALLVDGLPGGVRARLAEALRLTRGITPGYNNWLLFSAMVEAALQRMGEPADGMRLDLALRKHDEWYAGDGHYGDGPEFHWDYYNSFVIQPFLLDILRQTHPGSKWRTAFYERQQRIAGRYAEVQERLISPEGTYPPTGRSIAYRFGAFQLLAQAALQGLLPPALAPAGVREALTAVIGRTLGMPGMFDAEGWLRIGLAGAQPGLGETYISTGSLYLCTTVFLPLGLPADHPFWADPPAPWTAKRLWNGEDLPADHALRL